MAIVPPAPLTQQELDEHFPLKRAPLAADCFELGLVLGGTVSAGAYSGGVLDFLMEALDAWTRGKEQVNPLAPPHKVAISTIGGTSGGAINGAILTRAAGWSFPHGADSANPFYDSWTSGVDLQKLLDAKPEQGITGLASALNCGSIDAQAEKTIQFAGKPLGPANGTPSQRSYLADPLRLIMMVGNVTGLPYRIQFSGAAQPLAHDLVSHADYMRFGLTIPGGVPNQPRSRRDEIALGSNSTINWDQLRAAAVATSAFPLAFRSRALQRSLEACGYRVSVVSGSDGKTAEVVQLLPTWDILIPKDAQLQSVNFVNVDGGTFNNEPLDMVRTSLAGMFARNEQNGDLAKRATILIDPFSDAETLGPSAPPPLAGLVMPFIMSLIFQARFKPEDIALAYKEDVFSRFLMAPVGPAASGQHTIGSGAIASGGLGGFLGFVDPAFLKYDFNLGRRNAYDFLTRHFLFPENNPMFATWSAQQKDAYRVTDAQGVRFLPMIPIMQSVPVPPVVTAAQWPKLDKVPAWLPSLVENRLQAVYDAALKDNLPDNFFKRAAASSYLALGWKLYLRGALRDWAVTAITDGLKERGLV